jgi:hypothetical protein
VTVGRILRVTLTLLALSTGVGCGTVGVLLAVDTGAAEAARADATQPSPRPGTGARRAPSSPPLTSGVGAGEEASGISPRGEADPLVTNGLGSPLCRGEQGESELPIAGRRDCVTSGFAAAAAPTGNYGIDVHIDTGLLGLSTGGLLSVVQNLCLTPVWLALVWAMHAMVVMLEWCFTIDVLDSAAAGGLGTGLRHMQVAFTDPWLATVLAVASIVALYNGLIRRRVADTVGQALLMAAMMIGGMWVIADPKGTVGALGGWANGMSLGTLAVAARGTPVSPGRILGESMDSVFAAAIEAPWCYLEFGDVSWCRDTARLDPQLRAAGLKMAASESALIGCRPSSGSLLPCAASGSAQAKALEHSAALLREARSNGAIFLALAPNGPARNSISEQDSLLRAICRSSDATHCLGPAAAQAEFRTAGQTWSRVGGLVLITAGVLGMLLLLGFIALRLLAAAIFSLLYLLLAPGMVLAPALGEAGRAAFRKWVAQLLAAVLSKLLFSFLLGIVLAILAILSSLRALGWWTQWLLMSAFWWGAYMRRHQALGVAEGALGRERAQSPRSIVRRMSDVVDPPRKAYGAGRRIRERLLGTPSDEPSRMLPATADLRPGGRAGSRGDEQVKRTLEREHRDARELLGAAAESQERLSAKQAQLERVRSEQGRALARGGERRAAMLEHRAARVQEEVEREQAALHTARRVASEGARASRGAGEVYSHERAQQQDRFLDAQAALPASGRARDRREAGQRAGQRRDYRALAGLAGYGRQEYELLDPRRQRAARLEVDRELALRKELKATARSFGAGAAIARSVHGERPRFDREPDSPEGREAGQRRPGSRVGSSRESDHPGRSGGESSVMRDAREVAARRKRQLGAKRP